MTRDRGFLFDDLKKMASKHMRLMCLSDASFGIGWAAPGARLQDEVFLIPGCSMPIILRQHGTNRRYKLMGDSIVIPAMKNEIWKKIKQADVVKIEII
jgi:hypothetical protein